MPSLYEAVTEISNEMLLAVRQGDWETLAALEDLCQKHIDQIAVRGNQLPLNQDQQKIKVECLMQILSNDKEIRNIHEPWMSRLSYLMTPASGRHPRDA